MKFLSLFALSLLLIVRADAAVSVVPQSRSAAQLAPQSARIEATLDGAAGFARVKETWTFSNSATQNFEAELECEAPKNALMTGFAYYFHGERVVARVVEKTRAANIYNLFNPTNVPMAMRRDPALAEMLARNRLKVRVGPVEAKQPLVIELLYSQPLETRAQGRVLPLLLRGDAPITLEKFAFQSEGAPADAKLSLAPSAQFETRNFALPATATFSFAAPTQNAMLQSAGDSGYFAAILNETQWKTRANWKGSSDLVSKVLDAHRVLVAGRFKGASPAKVVGLSSITGAETARLWWMALQIETLESDPKNYSRVVELSNASNLPSAFSSWLAIPASERKAMEERFKPNNIWEQRQEMGKLGNALALWKAEGKTDTPQYRAMLKDFEARRAKSGDYYVSQTLAQREQTYIYWLQNTLDRYARTTDDLAGKKLPSFQRQFENLGAKDYLPALQKARETLRGRRIVARLVSVSVSGKTVDTAALPAEGRQEFVDQLANRSFDERLKNPVASRRLRALADRFAAQWGMDNRVASTLYSREYALLGEQITNVQAAYTASILKHQENTPYGQKLARRLAELTARTEFVGHNGLYLGDNIGGLYVEQQGERFAGKPDAARLARLQGEIERLSRLSGIAPQQIEAIKQQEWKFSGRYVIASLLSYESLTTGRETARARKLRREYDALGGNESGLTGTEQQVLLQIAEPLIDRYFAQVVEPTPDAAKIANLKAQIEALEARSPGNTGYLTRLLEPDNSFWRRQAALGLKIRAEGTKPNPDPKRIAALGEALGELAATSRRDWIYQRFWLDNAEGKGRGTAQEYGQARAQRLIVQDQIARTKTDFAAQKDNSLAARAAYDDQIARLRQRENQLRVRMGDPLIAVQAPENARLVLAILPTGALLPLEHNAQTGQWEARFDVPTYSAPGDYAIQIIVVTFDGKRQQLTMHLSVDLSAPAGLALGKIENGAAILSLETDQFTNRVTVFTPWGARLELRRDADGIFQNGIFQSRVALPADFGGGDWRFVVTDEAHNRTEIAIELKP